MAKTPNSIYGTALDTCLLNIVQNNSINNTGRYNDHVSHLFHHLDWHTSVLAPSPPEKLKAIFPMDST